MKALKTILITVLSVLILVGGGLFLAGYMAPKPGGIRIETNQKASIFINGAIVGETPYQESQKAGEILLRLVPVSTTENLIPYETSLTISPGIETVVNRNFANSEDLSSGYVITFDKTRQEAASLAVVSTPENAQVLVDGVSRGFSPYSVSAIAPAVHTITIKSPGFIDLLVTVNTKVGYRLTYYAKLAKGENVVPETSVGKVINVVKILDTPTGYLRVRSLPGTAGEEVFQAKPGDEYPYLGQDAETGWLEIQYDAPTTGLPNGLTGWISGTYATISSVLK